MSIIDDAQTTAIYYGKGVALPAGVQQASGTAIAETPTSGTAFQVSTVRSAFLYINVTTAAALTVAVSPDGVTFITVNASESDALGLITLDVPRGWYVKLTGTVADFAVTAVLN